MEGARISGASRIIGVDVIPSKFEQGISTHNFSEIMSIWTENVWTVLDVTSMGFICAFPAKKFGCTDFVNPKDYDKPVQEVLSACSQEL